MEHLNWGITTSSKPSHDTMEQARQLALEWNCPYVPRAGLSLACLKTNWNLDYVFVLDLTGQLILDEPHLFWHPGMALARLRRITRRSMKVTDPLLTVMELREGDRVLDCTLGMAWDALVAAWAVGDTGQVMGLEDSPIMAVISSWGLSHHVKQFSNNNLPMEKVASRITIQNTKALDYLKTQEDDSWDVVYFDPMFETGIHTSSPLNAFRPVASYEGFGLESFQEAIRVCRRRLVVKERTFSPIWRKYPFNKLYQRDKHPIAFGIFDKSSDQ